MHQHKSAKISINQRYTYFVALFIFVAALALFGMAGQANAVACTAPTKGAAYTVSATCNFSELVHGSDAGMTIATGQTLTVNAGQTIVWAPGSALVISGTITINSTAKLQQTYLWQKDADSDGYPDHTVMYAGATASAAGCTGTCQQRTAMTTYTTVDSYPTQSTCTTSTCTVASAATTVTFTIAADAHDGDTNQGASQGYPPSGTIIVTTNSTSVYAVRKHNITDNEYSVRASFFRWDTSSLPDNATVSAANFKPYVETKVNTSGAVRDLVAEYFAWGTLDTTDHTNTAANNAHSGTGITSLTSGAVNTLAMQNLTNINKTGFTELRVHTSGGVPGGGDEFSVLITDYAHATNPPADLVVTYTIPETVTATATANCYYDSDADTYGDGAGLAYSCSGTPPAGMVANNTDCDDTTSTKYQNLTGYRDADADTFNSSTGESVCSGAALPSPYVATVGTDCNDADATRWRNRYTDGDADTFGAGAATCVGNHAGYVDTGTDCLDTNANIYQNLASMVTDADNDIYPTAAAAATQCVGTSSTINARAYYKNASAAFTWCSNAVCTGGTDLNDANAAIGAYSYSQSTYYAYSQTTYYAYSQTTYYAYSQTTYYAYSQSTYAPAAKTCGAPGVIDPYPLKQSTLDSACSSYCGTFTASRTCTDPSPFATSSTLPTFNFSTCTKSGSSEATHSLAKCRVGCNQSSGPYDPPACISSQIYTTTCTCS